MSNLKTFLVCGLAGVGKSAFINKATGAQLPVSANIDYTGGVTEEGIPLIKAGNAYIQLVDTPGFGDSPENGETVVLRHITTWLVAQYMSKLPVTGVIYLRPIYDVRSSRLERAFMTMFKDMCGEDCLDHIILVTTRWSPRMAENEKAREAELVSRVDCFGPTGEKKVQVRRLSDQYSSEDAQSLVISCASLPPVTFQIQREVVDEAKTLGGTTAGLRLGLNLKRLLDLQAKALEATKCVTSLKMRLEALENERSGLEKELIRAIERAKQAAEAVEEARRAAEDGKNRMEQAQKEAEERTRHAEERERKAEEDIRGAQQNAKALRESLRLPI